MVQSLIPDFSSQTDELQKMIGRCEQAAFESALSKALWWGRAAHQEGKALAIISSLETRYPDLAQKEPQKGYFLEIGRASCRERV